MKNLADTCNSGMHISFKFILAAWCEVVKEACQISNTLLTFATGALDFFKLPTQLSLEKTIIVNNLKTDKNSQNM